MLKVVKRPKEYIAIKVPDNCNTIGKFVRKEARKAGINLDVTSYYTGAYFGSVFEILVGDPSGRVQFVRAGSVIVCELCEDDIQCPKDIFVMSKENFEKEFVAADKSDKRITVTPDANTDPLKSKLKEISDNISCKIEGVALPDDLKLSDSFIAELDKALNDYHQKQGQSSQRTSTPHVRIEFDDINDVPCVWVDGKRIDRSDTGLVSVSLDWHTKDPAATDHVICAYKIEYLKGDHREGIAQGSPMGPNLFKNDIHAK